MTNRFVMEYFQVTIESVSKKKREEIRKCNITRVEKDRNIDTKAHMVENLQGAKPNRAGVFLVRYQTFARHPRVESDGKEKEKILKKSLHLSVKTNFVDRPKKIF